MRGSLLRRLLLKMAGRRARRSLRTFVQASSVHDMPVTRCEPGKSKVAVLAPHMDDEVLGCGGTIARHVAAGSEVTVVFLTDGRRGGVVTEEGWGQADIVTVRKSEAQRAAAILGVRTLVFLDAEDSRLRFDRLVAARLRDVLERERPDILYLPFFLERHPDHRAANVVLFEATRGTSLRFECRGYEVWTALLPNCLVRIDETIDLKRQALACYRSQLAEMDYLHAGIGLSAFRAMSLGSHPGRFAEAFLALDLADYRKFHRAAAPPA